MMFSMVWAGTSGLGQNFRFGSELPGVLVFLNGGTGVREDVALQHFRIDVDLVALDHNLPDAADEARVRLATCDAIE
jgi:RecJ-like exonuclease